MLSLPYAHDTITAHIYICVLLLAGDTFDVSSPVEAAGVERLARLSTAPRWLVGAICLPVRLPRALVRALVARSGARSGRRGARWRRRVCAARRSGPRRLPPALGHLLLERNVGGVHPLECLLRLWRRVLVGVHEQRLLTERLGHLHAHVHVHGMHVHVRGASGDEGEGAGEGEGVGGSEGVGCAYEGEREAGGTTVRAAVRTMAVVRASAKPRPRMLR